MLKTLNRNSNEALNLRIVHMKTRKTVQISCAKRKKERNKQTNQKCHHISTKMYSFASVNGHKHSVEKNAIKYTRPERYQYRNGLVIRIDLK